MDFRLKTYITVGVFGLVWLILLIIAFVPLMNQIKTEANNYRSSQTELVRLNNQWQYIPQLTEEYERLGQNSSQLSNLFLKKEEALKFIEAVEGLARLTVGEFNIRNTVPSGNKAGEKSVIGQGITFQLDFESDFGKAMNFLAALENMDYFVEVEKIQFHRLETHSAELGAEGGVSVIQVKALFDIKVLADN